jgi:hypothetical protein
MSTTPSVVTYTGDGTTTDYAFSFPYLEREHIKVAVNGVEAPFTFLSQNLIRITSVPALGAFIRIYRETPGDPLVTWADGAVILGKDLNLATKQPAFVAQEAFDQASQAEALQGTSATSLTIGTGSKSLTTQGAKSFVVGSYVMILDSESPTTKWMHGQVTAYSGTALTVNVESVAGSGSGSSWSIVVSSPRGPAGAAGDGSGDMVKSTYDPQGIDGDAFERANHTGTQAIATVTGLAEAILGKADAAAVTAALADKVPTTRSIGAGVGLSGGGDLSANRSLAVAFANVAQFRSAATSVAITPNTAWIAAEIVTLTDAATVAVDMATFINAQVTMAGNRTIGNPTNTKVGQSGTIYLIQDSTGGRAPSFASNWKFAGGVAPTIDTTAGAITPVHYKVRSSTYIEAVVPGADDPSVTSVVVNQNTPSQPPGTTGGGIAVSSIAASIASGVLTLDLTRVWLGAVAEGGGSG